jgi:phosphatidate cytidylyltransferase
VLKRFVSAAILIPFIVLLLLLDYRLAKPESLGRYGVALSLIAVLLVSLAASEFVSLWKQPGAAASNAQPNRGIPNVWMVTFAAVVMAIIACVVPVWLVRFQQPGQAIAIADPGPWNPLLFSLCGLLVAFSISVGYEMWKFKSALLSHPGEITDRLGRSALIYVYLITLFGFLLPHRWLEGNGMGLVAIIGLIATIKMSDTCALFAGKAFGTTKLAPHLSPNKTIQGALGAYAGALAATAIVFFLVAPQVFGIEVQRPWWWFAAYALIVATAGILGDLAESMLKRDAHKKDSSSWIPGLGGILDVLDSLIFAGPISYLMWMI